MQRNGECRIANIEEETNGGVPVRGDPSPYGAFHNQAHSGLDGLTSVRDESPARIANAAFAIRYSTFFLPLRWIDAIQLADGRVDRLAAYVERIEQHRTIDDRRGADRGVAVRAHVVRQLARAPRVLLGRHVVIKTEDLIRSDERSGNL